MKKCAACHYEHDEGSPHNKAGDEPFIEIKASSQGDYHTAEGYGGYGPSKPVRWGTKQGAITLGVGGDGSDGGVGTFYEGAMTANYTSDATDAAVQASIIAVYGSVSVGD